MRRLKIPLRDDVLHGGLWGREGPGVLLAHGAGTNQDHPRIVELAEGLAGAGMTVLTFNYPYASSGRKRPDPQPVLLAAHRAARDRLASLTGAEVVLAGRSMGGRMGTYLAAAGEPCRGVVCLGYPLHPPGKPERLRADHLPAVGVPMLFVQGTRDALSRMDLFDRYVRSLPTVTVELLEGADHSLGGPRHLARTLGAIESWIRTLPDGPD